MSSVRHLMKEMLWLERRKSGSLIVKRRMTTSKRVQDRSKTKRIHSLESNVEIHKTFSKTLALLETLKLEPQMITPLKHIQRQLNTQLHNNAFNFIQSNPKLFATLRDRNGVVWCGLTDQAQCLVRELDALLLANYDRAVQVLTRVLMMTVDKRLDLAKFAHFRRDFGLPLDFRGDWVRRFPDFFRVVKDGEREFLELSGWNPAWSVTELEKNYGCGDGNAHVPGMLSIGFPMRFPEGYKKKIYRYKGKIEHFQKRSYLSPYADARGLKAGSLEFDKRAIAVMHELLSFTIEKRLVTDHLTHFRRELVMPQKLMRLLLKHCGIFYVSERGKRFSVFLNEAYEGSELIEKCPMVLWKEKVMSLVGYRGKKKRIEAFSDSEEMEGGNLFESDSEGETISADIEQDGSMDDLEDVRGMENSEMEVGELRSEKF